MKKLILLMVIMNVIIPAVTSAETSPKKEEITFGSGQWDSTRYGNHRFIIRLDKPCPAAAVEIPWRRRDNDPEKKHIIIVDAASGEMVQNAIWIDINREFGRLIFQPKTTPGDYYIYYMPHIHGGRANYPTVTYPPHSETADLAWIKSLGPKTPINFSKTWKVLPKAQVKAYEAIDAFNSFFPMEFIASAAEINTLAKSNPGKKYLLFPETRENSIRMMDAPPQKWMKTGPASMMRAEVLKGEYFVFQVGVYAVSADINNIEIQLTDWQNTANAMAIPAIAVTCFNLAGVNWDGEPFMKNLPIPAGKVQPLWFGIEIPEQLIPGEYVGVITFLPADLEKQELQVRLTVKDELLPDYGDNDPYRLSRLRWLNSRIGFDYNVPAPFTPVTVEKAENGFSFGILGRVLTINTAGFPVSLRSRFAPEVTHLSEGPGRDILAAPIRLTAVNEKGEPLTWKSSAPAAVIAQYPGLAGWSAENLDVSEKLKMQTSAAIECDGFIEYKVILEALDDLSVADIRLEIPYNLDAARYMMGLGQKGGFRPPRTDWKWDVQKNQDSAWLGDVNAGLQFHLRGANYDRPLNTNFYHSKPLNMPPSWWNEGKGGVEIAETGENTVLVKCFSGPRTMKKGQKEHFFFHLMVTPFKTLDTAGQWYTRFYHKFDPLEQIKARGANTVNVHHATEINPFINYPFLRPEAMKTYIDNAHGMGMKVKIYNTIRELSNFAPEIFALRSLGAEVISKGPGGGCAWLQEHLDGNYIAGWYVPEYKDAAIINSGMSRWLNFYLEGVDWLKRNVGVDGLYIDDLAFDRTTMKRLRKILDRGGRTGALIDLHSANQYNTRDGFTNSANLYLEHFPYINRLWFGEYFDYDFLPDFWLVEVSGIPFGLMGEMLEKGGNPWRGMLYGMTSRMPWAGDPSPLWKFWDEAGIQQARMIGYWSPNNPVKTNAPDVLATSYVRQGEKIIVALGSWAAGDTSCLLSVDWKKAGFKNGNFTISAPAIENFQSAASFRPGDAIPLEKGKGKILIITCISK